MVCSLKKKKKKKIRKFLKFNIPPSYCFTLIYLLKVSNVFSLIVFIVKTKMKMTCHFHSPETRGMVESSALSWVSKKNKMGIQPRLQQAEWRTRSTILKVSCRRIKQCPCPNFILTSHPLLGWKIDFLWRCWLIPGSWNMFFFDSKKVFDVSMNLYIHCGVSAYFILALFQPNKYICNI